MADGAANRKHIRLSAMGPVEVTSRGRTPREAYLASIGRGGLGIYTREQLDAAQLILVNLRLAGTGEADEEELRVAARVRWTRAAGQLWMAGLSFEQMSDQRYERLLRHLNVIERWQLGRPGQERADSKVRFTVRD